MKTLFKKYIWPFLLIFAGGMIDILLRSFSIERFQFLVKPIISINLVEIFIFVIIVIFAYKFIPSVYKKRSKKRRAENLLNNWRKFKALLQKYQTTKEDFQKDYTILRDDIEKDFNFFLDVIIKIQKETHRNYQDIVLRNFEACWSPRKLSEWQSRVRRRIPDELDCFDYILVSLVEHFSKL